MIPAIMWRVRWMSSEDGRGPWTHMIYTEDHAAAKAFVDRWKDNPYCSVDMTPILHGIDSLYQKLDLEM